MGTVSFSSNGIKKRRKERLKTLREKGVERSDNTEEEGIWSERAVWDEDVDLEEPSSQTRVRLTLVRWVLSLLLFAAVYTVFEMDAPGAHQLQGVVRTTLQQEFQFQRVAAWYDRQFGDVPGILPTITQKQPAAERVQSIDKSWVRPVDGKVVRSFQNQHQWVTVQTPSNTDVKAIAEGWVTYAGRHENIGLTVVIRHQEGTESWYGDLSDLRVQEGDWVYSGDVIGQVSAETKRHGGRLAFTIKYNNAFIDPAGVIQFE